MRTQNEIVDRIVKLKGEDIFGFEVSELLSALDEEHAGKFYENLTEWNQEFKDRDDVTNRMKEYLDFAYEKAINHRGISTMRSAAHYRGWAWLIGDDELIKFIDHPENYENYGAPILKFIADKYNVKVDLNENDQATFDAMAKGEKCPACKQGITEGCGNA